MLAGSGLPGVMGHLLYRPPDCCDIDSRVTDAKPVKMQPGHLDWSDSGRAGANRALASSLRKSGPVCADSGPGGALFHAPVRQHLPPLFSSFFSRRG